MNNKGKFIAFEGIDGSGKTTQIKRLLSRLDSLGIRYHETKEPTDSPIGLLIRQILTGRITMDNRVIPSLFVADRADHILNETNGLLRQIDSGVTVITDRYYFSSYAYQSVDVGMDWIIGANSINTGLLRPTLTVFLDVPVETALERIKRTRDSVELFEKEERLRSVREKYFEAFEKLKNEEKVVVIDASQGVDEVSQKIWAAISGYFDIHQ